MSAPSLLSRLGPPPNEAGSSTFSQAAPQTTTLPNQLPQQPEPLEQDVDISAQGAAHADAPLTEQIVQSAPQSELTQGEKQSAQDATPSMQDASKPKDGADKPHKPRRKKKKPNPDNEEPVVLLAPYLGLLEPEHASSKQRALHDEIVAYEKYISPTHAESAARERVHARIERVVLRSRFRDARVGVYGSSVTGLCLPNGDIDLVVRTRYATSEVEMRGALFQLRAALQRDGIVAQAYVVTNARHLVMNAVTSEDTGAFKVDISINSAEGLHGLDIVRDYLQCMPALRPLVMVIKGLLTQHGLEAAMRGGLSSYAITCMVISFLQCNPTHLPSEALEHPLENGTLGELLMDFLKYYADDFPYATSYISVRESAVLPKAAKNWPARKTNAENSLSIECLVDPENDIARAAQKMPSVRELFRKTHDALRGAVGGDEAVEHVLPAVLGVTQELIDYRARLEILHQNAEQLHYHSRPVAAATGTIGYKRDSRHDDSSRSFQQGYDVDRLSSASRVSSRGEYDRREDYGHGAPRQYDRRVHDDRRDARRPGWRPRY